MSDQKFAVGGHADIVFLTISSLVLSHYLNLINYEYEDSIE